jgi:hypothetical protein
MRSGPAPQASSLFWIKAGDLQFDDTYCRRVDKRWVNKLKAKFDKNLLGPIFVNQRGDLSLWCYSGRHRIRAMIELFDRDEEVLCLVTAHDDPEKLAKIAARFPGDPHAERRWEAGQWLKLDSGGIHPDTILVWLIVREIRREREADCRGSALDAGLRHLIA